MAAALILASAWSVARADGISLYLEPGFSHEDTESTDQARKTIHLIRNILTQNYRLQADKDLLQNLRFSGGGSFQDAITWARTDDAPSRTDDRTTDLFGRLSLHVPTLNAGVGLDRREASSSFAPTAVNETADAFASWRPLDLPDVDLRATRIHTYDATRKVQDSTLSTALVGTRYEVGALELRYRFNVANSSDALSRTESTSVDQAVVATYNDTFFDKRTSAYVTTTLEDRTLSTGVRGNGGTVARQQFPVAGLSFIETFPALPSADTLAPNPAVIDGSTTASAGLDIGFSASAGGDRNLRDVGAQFGDVVTSVNTVYVWVDKTLSAEVVRVFASSFTAYRSDDNTTWTPVPIAGLVVFGQFQNRFEITIQETQARYLKVTVAPLPLGVTLDRAFANILVTEAQFFVVQLASELPRHQSSYSAAVNAVARTTILKDQPSISHDLTVSATRQSGTSLTTYTVVNGLSFLEKLTRWLVASARGARQDDNAGRGHEGAWLWSASLVATPLPTLVDSITYTGQYNDTTATTTQTVNLFNRADLYDGVSAQANLGASYAEREAGRVTRGVNGSANLSVVPNRFVALGFGYVYAASDTTGGDQADVSSTFQRVDGSISITPAPAASASATVSRVLTGDRPTTLAAIQVNYSPLRGDLQLSFTYSRTLDTAAESTAQVITPSLRWTLRRNVFLNASYSALETTAPVAETRSRVVLTTLLISL